MHSAVPVWSVVRPLTPQVLHPATAVSSGPALELQCDPSVMPSAYPPTLPPGPEHKNPGNSPAPETRDSTVRIICTQGEHASPTREGLGQSAGGEAGECVTPPQCPSVTRNSFRKGHHEASSMRFYMNDALQL